MNVKCDYCGSLVDERSKFCPSCGAPLSGANRTSDEQPKTIEELQAWYVAHHLPPEYITRFFIGKDIKEPKAFGIYTTYNGDCVVYKNKSTGERAIRYQGADEAYAVNELYQRLRAEIVDQKSRNPGKAPQTSGRSQSTKTTTPPKKKKGCLIAIIVFLAFSVLMAIFDKSAPSGYYRYQGTEYYHYGSSWYYYDENTDDWYESRSMSDEINKDNANDYRYDNHTGKDFKSSSWYDSGSTSDDYDWDDDDDWGGYDDDDWDSGSTDWDSDW